MVVPDQEDEDATYWVTVLALDCDGGVVTGDGWGEPGEAGGDGGGDGEASLGGVIRFFPLGVVGACALVLRRQATVKSPPASTTGSPGSG